MMYAGENMPLDVMGSFWYYRKVHQLICFLCVISIWFQILLSRMGFFLLFDEKNNLYINWETNAD